jgi:hypothetical protein
MVAQFISKFWLAHQNAPKRHKWLYKHIMRTMGCEVFKELRTYTN